MIPTPTTAAQMREMAVGLDTIATLLDLKPGSGREADQRRECAAALRQGAEALDVLRELEAWLKTGSIGVSGGLRAREGGRFWWEGHAENVLEELAAIRARLASPQETT